MDTSGSDTACCCVIVFLSLTMPTSPSVCDGSRQTVPLQPGRSFSVGDCR